MWDRRVVEMIDEAVGDYSVSCRFRGVVDHFEWAFSGVYGPQNDRERSLMWDELAGLASWWGIPWCIGGDFNVTRFPTERLGGATFNPTMQDFSEFISYFGLMDIPLEGGKYTWSNNRTDVSMSRIDRFLYSTDWEDHFPAIHQKRLPRLLSDHYPIMLECGDFSKGRRPFRFKNMWLGADGFVDKVKGWWESYHFEGTPSFILARKLRALKFDLKQWNAEVFGDVLNRRRQAMADLNELDVEAESRPLSSDEAAKKFRLVEELEKSFLQEEISWRQKSRAIWLQEGDKNTKFFHRIANSNRRSNFISSLMINGELS